jgi:hypothetical protein
MNDDYYILQHIKELKYYKYWTLSDHVNHLQVSNPEYLWTKYYKAIYSVYKKYPTWDNFETHTPIILNKWKLWRLIVKYKWVKWATRTRYCNEYNIVGEFIPNTPNYKNRKWLVDCKVFSEDMLYTKEWQPFLSSAENIVDHPKFIEIIKSYFPNPSPYEK